MAAAGFLSHYLSGPLPYVRRYITVNKTFPRPFIYSYVVKVGMRTLEHCNIDIKCVWLFYIYSTVIALEPLMLISDEAGRSSEVTTGVTKAVVCAILYVGWCI